MSEFSTHINSLRLIADNPDAYAYEDVAGICRESASQIADLQAQVAALELQRKAFFDLVSESYGVAGLHLNGDVEPWEGLLESGRFEEWLGVFGPPPTASEGEGDG